MVGAVEAFREFECVWIKDAISLERRRALAGFVAEHNERFERRFAAEFGFPLSDTARLAEWLDEGAGSSSRYASLSPEWKHLVRGELPLEVRISPSLKVICEEPWLTAFLRETLNDPIIRMHHPPSIRVARPGMSSSLVPLHQDRSYATHLREFVTVWVPLCDIDDAAGGLEVVARARTGDAIPHRTAGIWLNMEGTVSDDDRVPMFCRFGDVIVFGPQLVHGSRPNRSARIRLSVDYRFFASRETSPKHFYDLEHREVIPPSEV